MPGSADQREQRGKRTRTAYDEDNLESSKRKRSKRSRLSKNAKEALGQQLVREAQEGENAVGSSLVKSTEPKQQISGQLKETPGWSLSKAGGGRFTDMDPIFTPDGQHIILGLETAIHVFSLSTSRLIRVLETKKRQHVTSYKLSQSNPTHIYISTQSGNITKWDWNSGQKIRSWETSSHILDLDIGLHETGDSAQDAILTLHKHGNGQRAISLSSPETNSSSRRLDWKVILETSTLIEAVQSADHGKVLIVRAGEKLLVGTTSGWVDDGFAPTDYTWREIAIPIVATCFDTCESDSADAHANKPSKKGQARVVDVVVGGSQGSLLIYNDILNTLNQIEATHDTETGLISSRLHWHRNAVKSARWSKDGNYIISGGLETVLVLWQLDTGRKSFLPHLSSQICNITVSPAGDSYGIKLSDNSVMVLSTGELQPTASINGLQLPSVVRSTARKPIPKDATSESKTASKTTNGTHFAPAVLHPLKPSHLLLAASAQLTSEKPSQCNILQTFDIETYHQVSRQALTRTNATVINTAPDGSEITTPNIQHIGITNDGRWLASIDEWMPQSQTPKVLHVDHVESEGDVNWNREVFLKFWEWNDGRGEWELVTRIDAPHYEPSLGSTHILDLAVNPGGSEFATIGCDGVVKFWTCGARYRRENRTQASGDRRLKTWRCRNTVGIQSTSATQNTGTNTGSLRFSEDGSVLAICWANGLNHGGRAVYLTDTQTCEVHQVRDGLCEGIPRAVGFLGRDLIALSNRVTVWDTVDDKLKFSSSLLLDTSTDGGRPYLSINPRSNTFAVVFGDSKSKYASRVQVFSAQTLEPLFETGLKDEPHAVLADPTSGDHIIIDTAAQIKRIGSRQSTSVRNMPEISSLTSVFGNVFGKSLDDASGNRREPQAFRAEESVRGPGDNDDRLFTKNLSGIFEKASGLTLPTIGILFEDMMSLFKK